jgi:hypothetical protein
LRGAECLEDRRLLAAATVIPAAASSISPVALSDLPRLHSNAAADQKIYLDFDGQTVLGTVWNEQNKGRAIDAPAFDTDGDVRTFSAGELATIEAVWSRVAEDFSPFDIDVTTEEPAADAFRAGSQAIRVLVSTNIDQTTGNQWYPNLGGVAQMNSWQWTSDTPVWVFSNQLAGNEKRLAESASHEIGHALGLSHDGVAATTTTSELDYYAGHGSGATSWAPIMGIGFDREVTQWSAGEYHGANNHEGDLTIIASQANKIRFRPDEDGNSLATANFWWLPADTQTQRQGVITTFLDVDLFRLFLFGGQVHIQAQPASLGPNLDLAIQLLDADGHTIAMSNPADSLAASLSLDLPAGQYFLSVRGAGFGDPATTGYSPYGSVGQYTITASQAAPVEVEPLPTPPASTVVGRHLFYNESAYDDGLSTLSARDAVSVAADKIALLPGQTASFANYSSYTRGLNGIAIDITHLPEATQINLRDFLFHVGNSSELRIWQVAPQPSSLLVVPGAGEGGSDRILLAWPNASIVNKWLRVTVIASEHTGLSQPDTFYFGNAVAETGNSSANAVVDGADFMDLLRQQGTAASSNSRYDLNRDGQIDMWDLLAIVAHHLIAGDTLQLIRPGPQAVPSLGDSIRAMAISYAAQVRDEEQDLARFASLVDRIGNLWKLHL